MDETRMLRIHRNLDQVKRLMEAEQMMMSVNGADVSIAAYQAIDAAIAELLDKCREELKMP